VTTWEPRPEPSGLSRFRCRVVATFEIAAAEMALCFHMSDHRLDGGAPRELAFDVVITEESNQGLTSYLRSRRLILPAEAPCP